MKVKIKTCYIKKGKIPDSASEMNKTLTEKSAKDYPHSK